MESGSHLSTLRRLHVWGKKLYDEVKVFGSPELHIVSSIVDCSFRRHTRHQRNCNFSGCRNIWTEHSSIKRPGETCLLSLLHRLYCNMKLLFRPLSYCNSL